MIYQKTSNSHLRHLLEVKPCSSNIIFGQKYLQSTDVLSSIDTVLENIVVKVSYRGKKIEESLSSRLITK